MSENDTTDFNVTTVEIYKNLIEALQHLSPHLVQSIGGLATGETTEAPSLGAVRDMSVQLVDTITEVIASIDSAQEPTPEPQATKEPELPKAVPETPVEKPKDVEPLAPEEPASVVNPEFDYTGALIAFLREQPTKQVHIGVIVRQYYGVDRLAPAEYGDLVTWLNDLARQGQITHQGPLYGALPVDKDESVIEAEAELPEEEESTEEVDILDKLKQTAEGIEAPNLSLLEQRILTYAQSRGLFRIEELHRDIPELAAMSDAEYKEFKAEFPAMRTRIEEFFLSQVGNSAVWRLEGRNRGRKYNLVVENKIKLKLPRITRTPQPKKTNKRILTGQRPPQVVVRFYEKEQTEQTAVEPVPDKPLSLHEQQRQFREGARLAGRLVMAIERMPVPEGENGIRLTTIAREISKIVGIPLDKAKQTTRQLMAADLLFVSGDHKGTRLLSTDKSKEIDLTAAKAIATEAAENKEQERIQALREQYGIPVLEFLNGLIKEQTEYKTTIAKAVDGLDVEDVNAICNLMRSEGLVISKEEQGRGSRKGRKGKTWRLSGKGRNLVTQFQRGGSLTNAQKKRMSDLYVKQHR